MNSGQQALGNGTRRRVLIVDDNPYVRRELRFLLPLAGDIEIVGEAADGAEAIHLSTLLQPHVVLIDLEMPVLDGYAATRQIKAQCPACRIVALTAHGYEAARRKALQSGVDTFVVKGAAIDTLVQAITERSES